MRDEPITADSSKKKKVKDVNLDIIIDTLWWYKAWQHSGYNHTHVNQKLFRKRKRAYKSSCSRRGNQKSFYTDNSLEFGKACEDLSWNHCTSTTHRSETDGIADRAVRRIKEGTSAVLLPSGLDDKWLAESVECFTYLRNIQDLLSDGETPYERRFGEPFKGPIIPFGSMIEHHPISAKDLSQLHQFDTKVSLYFFLGHGLHAGESGKETLWSQTLRSWKGRTHQKSTQEDSMQRKWITPMNGENFIFPIADRTVKRSGGDQVLRTSPLILDHPDRGEERRNLLRESDGSSPTPFQDSSPCDGEARNDFWSISRKSR